VRDGVYAFVPEEAKGYKFRFLSRFPVSVTLKALFTLSKNYGEAPYVGGWSAVPLL